jgi:probable rRNA maturation factor
MKKPRRPPAKLERVLERTAQDTLSLLGLRGASAEVSVLPDATMRELKKRFLGREKFADVLAFPETENFPVPEGANRSLGEVYLNSSFVREPERLRFLLVHGLLHLLGYHHEKRRDMITMQRVEREICSAIGVRSAVW